MCSQHNLFIINVQLNRAPQSGKCPSSHTFELILSHTFYKTTKKKLIEKLFIFFFFFFSIRIRHSEDCTSTSSSLSPSTSPSTSSTLSPIDERNDVLFTSMDNKNDNNELCDMSTMQTNNTQCTSTFERPATINGFDWNDNREEKN